MDEELTCLEHGPDCKGKVERRMALSPTGVWHPRCDKHWTARLKTQSRLVRDYGVRYSY